MSKSEDTQRYFVGPTSNLHPGVVSPMGIECHRQWTGGTKTQQSTLNSEPLDRGMTDMKTTDTFSM